MPNKVAQLKEGMLLWGDQAITVMYLAPALNHKLREVEMLRVEQLKEPHDQGLKDPGKRLKIV